VGYWDTKVLPEGAHLDDAGEVVIPVWCLLVLDRIHARIAGARFNQGYGHPFPRSLGVLLVQDTKRSGHFRRVGIWEGGLDEMPGLIPRTVFKIV
jgi:hypothetical protein